MVLARPTENVVVVPHLLKDRTVRFQVSIFDEFTTNVICHNIDGYTKQDNNNMLIYKITVIPHNRLQQQQQQQQRKCSFKRSHV